MKRYNLGDIVLDSWGGGTPSKATVIEIEKRLFSTRYFIRHVRSGYESPYPRTSEDLSIIERQEDVQRRLAEEHKPPRITQEEIMDRQRTQIENQRRLAEALAMKSPRAELYEDEWFDVLMTQNLGKYLSSGEIVKGRLRADGNYKLVSGKTEYNISPHLFRNHCEKYRIEDYATEFPFKKEEKDMGGELYGYPPEEDEKVAQVKREADMAIERSRAKIHELEKQLAEKEAQNEIARRQAVAQEYGIVAERHLWDVVVDVPMSWVGKRMPGGGERSTEVITEGRNMCEAAMAAEAMAKGISDEAYVVSIKYNRVLGALK